MSQQNTTTAETTANETTSPDKIYPHCGVDEIYLEEGKPLYVARYDNTGAIRIANTPITPRLIEDPEQPRGEVPFEAFVETAEGRHWLIHMLFEAEWETRWSGEVPRSYRLVAPINEQAEMSHYDSWREHSLVLERTNGEHVSFIVGIEPTREIELSVNTTVEDESVYREKVRLSYQEARLLRDLLNRPEVAAILDQEA